MKKYKLLLKNQAVVNATLPDYEISEAATLQKILITKIVVERNPRKRFDEESLAELAQSIQSRGLQQPIIVEPGPAEDTFVLVSGERRLRAHKKLGKTKIQALVRARSNHDGRERFLDAVIENDQREEMTAIELAHAYRALSDEYDMSVRDISKRIGKSEFKISRLIQLTFLDQEIQDLIERGFWKDYRLASLLLKITDKMVRVELAKRLFTQKVSLKGSLKAVERTIQEMATSTGKFTDFHEGTPALKIVGAVKQPMHWNMLMQLGQLPPWKLVVLNAEQTCEQCPIRSIASKSNCKDCGAVHLLRRMMEAAK